MVEHVHGVRESVGLLQVLRGEQHRGACRLELGQDRPELLAAGRVEPGRRLVQHQQVGPVHQAGGEVEAAAHAAGVSAHHPVDGVGQAERSASSAARVLRGPAAKAGQAADEDQVVPAAQRVVEPRVLPGEPDARPDLGRLLHGRSPNTRTWPPSALARVAMIRTRVVLPGAVRAEQRGQRARRDREIHSVERLDTAPAKCLMDSAGLDGRRNIAHIVRLTVSEVTGQYG